CRSPAPEAEAALSRRLRGSAACAGTSECWLVAHSVVGQFGAGGGPTLAGHRSPPRWGTRRQAFGAGSRCWLWRRRCHSNATDRPNLRLKSRCTVKPAVRRFLDVSPAEGGLAAVSISGREALTWGRAERATQMRSARCAVVCRVNRPLT